jgi:hypothetical protein
VSVVVGRLAAGGRSPLDVALVERWVPLPGGSSRVFRGVDGSAELVELSWGSVLDRPFALVGSSVIAVQGYPRWPSAIEERFERVVCAAEVPAMDAVPGSASGLVLRDGELRAYAGATGEYGLHVRVTDRDVTVSNRLAVLLGLSGASAGEAAVDESSTAWLAGFGWRPGGSRSWRGVRQLRPGERMVARVVGDRIEVVFEEPPLGDLFAGLGGPAARARMDEVLTACTDGVASIEVDPARWRLPLSGGKDSRAVLGLLAAAGRLGDVGTVYTEGPPYGIEVLAASQVARSAGIDGARYRIQRPSVHLRQTDVVDLLLRTLDSTQGTLSAYDTHGVSRSPHLTLGGHQYAIRPDTFSGAPDGSVEAVFGHVLARKPLDPAGLLAPEAVAGLREEYLAMFQALLDRGVPLSRLGDTAYWLMRASGWMANLGGGNQYANPVVNPLLDAELLALACAVPRVCVEAEVIPFLAMRRSGLPIDAQPFAGDQWRPGLRHALEDLGVRASTPSQVPFTTPGALRLLADPYRPGAKVELLRRFGPLFSHLVREQQADLPILDVAATEDAFRAASGAVPGVQALISLLGVGTVVLLREYGTDLFDQTRREDLRRELTARAAPDPSGTTTTLVPEEATALRRLVVVRDDALATLALERHQLQRALARRTQPERPTAPPQPRTTVTAGRVFRSLPAPVRTHVHRARRLLRARTRRL